MKCKHAWSNETCVEIPPGVNWGGHKISFRLCHKCQIAQELTVDPIPDGTSLGEIVERGLSLNDVCIVLTVGDDSAEAALSGYITIDDARLAQLRQYQVDYNNQIKKSRQDAEKMAVARAVELLKDKKLLPQEFKYTVKEEAADIPKQLLDPTYA